MSLAPNVIAPPALEVVDDANIFDVHSSLQWHDCPDTVESDKYWYDPETSTFKKVEGPLDKSVVGELAVDAEGNYIERYVWDWDNEVWTKVQIINQ